MTDTTALGYYSYVVVPPIQRMLDILLATMPIGGSRRPLIRELAEQADVALGAVTDLLRQLATDGWILYDGRTITLMRDSIELPSDLIDHVIDQDDDLEESAVCCAVMPNAATRDSDRSRDRSESPPTPPMEYIYATTADSVAVDLESTMGGSGGDERNDRTADRSHCDHPIALLLAELGTAPGPGVLDRVLSARHWTPQQIRDRWVYDQARIAKSGGRLTEGIFWTALMAGQLAPGSPDPTRPIDTAAYAGDDAFAPGGAPAGDEESIRDHALRLLPPPTAETHAARTRDWMFVQCRLGMGDSDEQALAALAEYRTQVRR